MSVFLRYDRTLSVSDAVAVFIMDKKNTCRILSFDAVRGSSGYMSTDRELSIFRNIPDTSRFLATGRIGNTMTVAQVSKCRAKHWRMALIL